MNVFILKCIIRNSRAKSPLNFSFGIGLRILIYLKLNICKMIMLEINFCNKTSLKTNCHSPLNTPYANVCLLSNLAECHDANWVHVKGCFDWVWHTFWVLQIKTSVEYKNLRRVEYNLWYDALYKRWHFMTFCVLKEKLSTFCYYLLKLS